jgi:glucokinase
LSGPGLENLHTALLELDGKPTQKLAAAEIAETADRGEPSAVATIDMFCAVLGTVAGDYALAHGARGGVLIAGGIAQKIAKRLEKSRFRSRFENKGRLSPYVKSIPTRLIICEDVAFRGAARAAIEFGTTEGHT